MKNQLLIIPRLVSFAIFLFLISTTNVLAQSTLGLAGGSPATGFYYFPSNYGLSLGSGYATGTYAIAFGGNSTASGEYSAAFGYYTTASGNYSFALGSSEASGEYAFAAGNNSKASGKYSFSLGTSESQGYYSFSGGTSSLARSDYSFTFGSDLISDTPWTTVFGRYNVDLAIYNGHYWEDAEPLFVLGNGSSDTDRSNALTILKNGNVGIDMSDPTGDLQLDGLAQRMIFSTTTPQQTASARIEFWENHDGISDGSNAHFAMQYDGLIDGFRFKGKESGTNLDADIMTLRRNGRVGIGTTSPSTKLDIRDGDLTVYKNDILLLDKNNGSADGMGIGYMDVSKMSVFSDAEIHFRESDTNATKVWMDLNNGTMGIGTTSTFGYQLAVNGTIGATEIKVETSSAWPDYVFADDYVLPSLKETKEFIKENGHLSDIPSAVEVEENGIALGEMNRLLLQKIEELTLHLIEKDEEIKSLKEDTAVRLAALEETLKKMEQTR